MFISVLGAFSSQMLSSDGLENTENSGESGAANPLHGNSPLGMAFPLAAEGPLARPARPLARQLLAKDDPALGKIVGRHFDMDAVADHRFDAETPHLAGRVGDDPMLVVEHHA